MEEREYLIELYERYGKLLTKKQQESFEKYYFEDLSLNEIADVNKVTKSLVGKTISQVEKKLIIYEDKLELNKKMKKLKQISGKITDENIKRKIEEVIY